MRTYAQKPKASQQTPAVKIMLPSWIHFGQRHEANKILNLQTSHSGFDFSRIPLHPRTSNCGPFDASARAHYRLGLGTNLADIRVQTDEHAAASAEARAAEAYANGNELHRHAAEPHAWTSTEPDRFPRSTT